MNHGGEFRAIEVSGIPSEVLVLLAASGVGQLKTSLVWKLHKGEKGYRLSSFWITGEGRHDTLNNANNSPQHERLVNGNGPIKQEEATKPEVNAGVPAKEASWSQMLIN